MVFPLSSTGSFNCHHVPYHLVLFLRIMVVSHDFCLDSPDLLISVSEFQSMAQAATTVSQG